MSGLGCIKYVTGRLYNIEATVYIKNDHLQTEDIK